MKELELMGVHEMNAIDLKNRNGGILWLALSVLVLPEILSNPKTHWEAFKEGWDMAKK